MDSGPSIDAWLGTPPGAQAWLCNLRRCASQGLIDDRAPTRLQSTLSDAPPEGDRLAHLCTALAPLFDDSARDRLRLAFAAVYRDSFPIVKVVTRATYENYLTLKPARQADSTARLRAPVDDREPELMPPALADRSAAAPPVRSLRPQVALAPPDGISFVTDWAGWQRWLGLRPADEREDTAEAAMLWLGLSYVPGTHLTAIVVQRGLDLHAAGCRRPTLVDAGSHPWWFCWHDDPLHLGHTIDLEGFDPRRPTRGAREWVMQAVQIDTALEAVQAHHLGQTRSDTHAGNILMRQQFDQTLGGWAA